ncbi:MAG: integrase core domain-containing protein [Opitutaceae bacterium]|nr:integrase core domain-containing protein [Opitutaceae bacterium]
MKTLSLDLRERIVVAYYAKDSTREMVAARFRVSLGMVKKLLQQRRRLGEIGAQHHPRVTQALDCVTELRGRPTSLITDNGPEFAGLELERWTHDRQVQHRFITPGKPAQNGYIERFNGKLRDECLNEHKFINLQHARKLIERFWEDYNQLRPHSSLGDLTPAEFAAKIAQAPMGASVDRNNPSLAVVAPTHKPNPTDPLP